MNIGSAFPGTYLKASDLQGRNINIAMHSVQMEELGGEHKPVLYFKDSNGGRKDRGLVLNKTNANIIAEMYGWETDGWVDRVITLYPARVEFSGRIVDAIRVRLDQSNTAPAESQAPMASPASMIGPFVPPAPPAQAPKTAAHDNPIMNDEIPF